MATRPGKLHVLGHTLIAVGDREAHASAVKFTVAPRSVVIESAYTNRGSHRKRGS